MNIHKNARLTVAGRLAVATAVLGGQDPAAVARGAACSVRTVWKWVARFRTGGAAALADRSSRPHRLTQLPRPQRRAILRGRTRRRWSSTRIAQETGIPLSTVIHFLRRHGLQRLPRLEPPRAVRRYEMRAPGELLHVDTKKLGRIGRVGHRIHGDRRTRVRGIGWEAVHVAVDAYSRVAYAEVLPDERAATTAAFLARAIAWYAALGVRVRAVLTDNGSCYRSHAVRTLLRCDGITHKRTMPYTPRTNGKVERLIQTLLREWAYARPYPSSRVRTEWLARYLRTYNEARGHSALNYLPPMLHLAAAL
ncbi:IS481 family transposase [Pseudogemmatithrix spongiicola]|uniref:IS481 family transposase n=1 Tax=Pseudogemmatithrix spongiicola TaxID=3062599 RepID=A0AA49JRV2_9BACT|nr:IS481 family transposase [Gemmatimonadaceae bacterium 'strain 138']WKW13730.1 IS481 family transposase [Gemmatimonadaceae bacterium 'strain 318']WKW10926.1 IS481 family transposase [Gemmatimonadaceae bacterium 'strain 138']WKW11684.1 IS481 family transposase [Gemmatimonadaceae bacterium 'strain 138']WKW11742.1 IS481 family transposase [Gemmatimonadaceae bacterium 'strain 138']